MQRFSSGSKWSASQAWNAKVKAGKKIPNLLHPSPLLTKVGLKVRSTQYLRTISLAYQTDSYRSHGGWQSAETGTQGDKKWRFTSSRFHWTNGIVRSHSAAAKFGSNYQSLGEFTGREGWQQSFLATVLLLSSPKVQTDRQMATRVTKLLRELEACVSTFDCAVGFVQSTNTTL